ncbi:hypothetical protein MTO96_042066 [Rhipicephalus appendiculatus]
MSRPHVLLLQETLCEVATFSGYRVVAMKGFLLAYRNTPQATTAEAPSVLLLGRRLRTRLDLVRPSVNDTVAHKQFREASRHRRRESTFREGDLVRVRNFRRGPRWFSATVLARTGPVSYRAWFNPYALLSPSLAIDLLSSAVLAFRAADPAARFETTLAVHVPEV